MTRYALIQDGLVVNVIVWDGEDPYKTDLDAILLPEDSPVGIGWTIDGDTWTAPEPAEEL